MVAFNPQNQNKTEGLIWLEPQRYRSVWYRDIAWESIYKPWLDHRRPKDNQDMEYEIVFRRD